MASPTPDDPHTTTRVDELLLRVLDAPEAEQQSVLAAVCADAPELAARLQRRLQDLSAYGMLTAAAEPEEGRPDRIGPYRVLDVLGRGSMGVVYLAQHDQLDRRVALKCIRSESAGYDRARERFRREAQALARVQHPGLAALYDVGEWQGRPYLAMQFVDGETLDEHLRRARSHGALCWRRASASPGPSDTTTQREGDPCRDAVALVADLALAVHEVHEAGVIHRDLKPANVMVTASGRPVLIDFGLARNLDEDTRSITLSTDTIGTPAYMAPEQIEPKGRTIDRRVDVHALGALLYECLTLRLPFPGENREQTYRRILGDEPIELRRLQPAASRDLNSVVQRALAKAPEQRFADAREFAEELQRVLRGQPTLTRPAGPVRRLLQWARQRPAVASGIATAAMMLVAGLALALVVLRQQRAAILTTEALDASRRDSARGAVLAAAALDAGGGQPARSALYAALSDLRLVRSWPLWNTGTAVTANANGNVLAAGIWGGREDDETTVHLFRDGVEVARPVAAGRTRVLDLDERMEVLLAVGHLPEARLFDLRGQGVAVLRAQPDAVFEQLHGRPVAEKLPFGTIAGGIQGDVVFTVTRDGHVRLFDRHGQVDASRCCLVPPPAGSDWIAADRDPRTGALVFGSRSGHVVCCLADGSPRQPARMLAGPATFVAWSPTGDRFAAATGYRRYWWDIDGAVEHRDFVVMVIDQDGAEQALRGHTDYLTDLRWSPDGTALITASEDATARIWDVARTSMNGSAPCFVLPHDKPVHHARFGADGETVVTGMGAGDAWIWSRRGLQLGGMLGHVSGTYAMGAVGTDRVVTASMDKRLLAWDLHSRSFRQHLCGGPIAAAGWLADGSANWSVRMSGEVQLWQTHPTQPLRSVDLRAQLRPDEELWSAVCIPPSIWIGTSQGRVLRVDVQTDAVQAIQDGVGPERHRKSVGVPGVFRDGAGVFAVSPTELVPVTAPEDARSTWPLRCPHGGEFTSFDRHPDRPLGAVGSTAARIAFFDLAQQRPPASSEPLGSTVMGVAWGHDDTLFASTRDGLVLAMDSSGQERWRRDLGVFLWQLDVSPDGRLLVVACADRRARVLGADGELRLVLPETPGRIRSVEFAPDGRFVMVASHGGCLRVWPLLLRESGSEILMASPYRAAIEAAQAELR